jgi:hypothetical protein
MPCTSAPFGWGDDPPFHVPVFVLTHHPREPLVMEGGTTPLLLGGGTHLFGALGIDPIELEIVRVIASPRVTHLRYRIG